MTLRKRRISDKAFDKTLFDFMEREKLGVRYVVSEDAWGAYGRPGEDHWPACHKSPRAAIAIVRNIIRASRKRGSR